MLKELSSVQYAYIAGIIDGEGTITLTTHKKGCYPSPTITIASTDYELLQWLRDTLGAGNIVKKRNYNPEKHKDSWALMIRHNCAYELLKCIEPYLIINKKKSRCSLIINEYKRITPRNGRYSEELLQKKEKFYATFMSL
ncbi:MAG: hypothetical protein VR72_20420 [Clostridiaceae bacterium BRH_c20a]|nr:MAG: hypothetical protein VR72_20420 [Clostridiaceae bacterium BRH_c20a]